MFVVLVLFVFHSCVFICCSCCSSYKHGYLSTGWLFMFFMTEFLIFCNIIFCINCSSFLFSRFLISCKQLESFNWKGCLGLIICFLLQLLLLFSFLSHMFFLGFFNRSVVLMNTRMFLRRTPAQLSRHETVFSFPLLLPLSLHPPPTSPPPPSLFVFLIFSIQKRMINMI